MNKFSDAAKRFGGFMKRNAFYFLIVLCIASVATVIALAVTRSNTQTTPVEEVPVDNPVPDPTTPTVTYVLPVNSGTVLRGYSDTELVWNQTLGQYSTHCGIDYTSADLNVYCISDGKVKEVGYDDLNGNYITVEHSDGYVSCYYSLSAASTFKANDTIKQGQLLGQMSTTQGTESLDGAHLHFEMFKNGVPVNPLEVIVQETK